MTRDFTTASSTRSTAARRRSGSRELFPTRRLYQFVQRTEPGHPLLEPSYIVEPMRIVSGAPVQLRFQATNTEKLPVVVARVAINGRTVAKRVLDRNSHAGATTAFDVVLGTSAPSTNASRPATLFARVSRDAQVSVDVAFGPDAESARADIFERRYVVARVGDGLAVQTPGLQYHRFDVGHVVWVRQNVEAHLAER